MPRLIDAVKRSLPESVAVVMRRALFPLRNRALFRPYTIRGKQMEGETFDFYVGDRQGRDWYDRPCINNPRWLEMRFVRDRIVTSGDVILEAGGHHGCSAILLSRWVGPTGRVVTFEPDAAYCPILRRNITLNNLSNVTLHEVAVGAERGTATFDASRSGVDPAGHGRTVSVVKLDDFAHLAPTVLKIDVEGFEYDVLRGAAQILTTRPKLALEIHPAELARYGHSAADVLALLPPRYDLFVQWRDDEVPTVYDGRPITARCHLFGVPLH